MGGIANLIRRIASFVRDILRREKRLAFTVVGVLMGLLAIVLYASQASNWRQFVSTIGVAMMIACASVLSGGLVGFLFGIPRKLQQEGVSQNAEGEDASQDKRQGPSYQTNTNLEQISDWLTKILVGVGLTQISKLPEVLRAYADYTATGLGNYAGNKVFSLALLAYFSIGGFLVSYLLTRLNLLSAFVKADVSAAVAQVQDKMTKIEREIAADAKAMSLVRRQLNPGTDTHKIEQKELDAAIQQATSATRAGIFYMAQDIRRNTWDKPELRHKMERTIPIFRALAASDPDDEYHANHGQLGYALKDLGDGFLEEAESELTQAIVIRDFHQELGWLWYEGNRAFCRIKLDPAFNRGAPSDEKTRQLILDDLRAAYRASDVAQVIEDQEPYTSWMAVNEVSIDDLAQMADDFV